MVIPANVCEFVVSLFHFFFFFFVSSSRLRLRYRDYRKLLMQGENIHVSNNFPLDAYNLNVVSGYVQVTLKFYVDSMLILR